MTFKDLPPGRYPCRIVDWGLTEVKQLDNALKVTIELAITTATDGIVTGYWDGLMTKKDGTINEKTMKTILSAGFGQTDIYTLNSDLTALDTQKEMEVTIGKDDKGRTKAEWLNSAGGGGVKKEALPKKKNLVIEGALAQALKTKKSKKKESDDGELNF